MGADRNYSFLSPLAKPVNVPNFVLRNFLDPERPKLLPHPLRACRFAKRRRRNARQFHLPARELSFLVPEPLQRGPHLGHRSQAGGLQMEIRCLLTIYAGGLAHGRNFILQPISAPTLKGIRSWWSLLRLRVKDAP